MIAINGSNDQSGIGKTMSFSEIQGEDQTNISQYNFLQTQASPSKNNEKVQSRKVKRKFVDQVIMSRSSGSRSGSLPSTLSNNDIDEGLAQPNVSKIKMTDPDMIQGLNDRPLDSLDDENTAIPDFQGGMPIKSMDLSDVGFRERYQNALLSTNTPLGYQN